MDIFAGKAEASKNVSTLFRVNVPVTGGSELLHVKVYAPNDCVPPPL